MANRNEQAAPSEAGKKEKRGEQRGAGRHGEEPREQMDFLKEEEATATNSDEQRKELQHIKDELELIAMDYHE